MKKLFFLLFTNLLVVYSFSQPAVIFTKALKGYDVRNVVDWDVLDENTYITTVLAKQKSRTRFIQFLITYDPEIHEYVTEKLVYDHLEISKPGTYCKMGDKIYRIRTKVVKKELCFYNDLLVGDRFQMAFTPFFKAVGKYSEFKPIRSKILDRDSSFFIMTYKLGDCTVNEFKKDGFQLISTNQHAVPNGIYEDHFFHKNQLISVFKLQQEESGNYKIGFIVWSDTNAKYFILDNVFDKYMRFNPVNQEENVFITVFNEKDVKFQLFDVNLENESIEFKWEREISGIQYPPKHNTRFVQAYNQSSQINDANGNLYLLYYEYLVGSKFPSVGNLWVLKISKGEFVWEQMVLRTSREYPPSHFPTVSIEGDHIQLRDNELKVAFNKEGNFIFGLEKIFLNNPATVLVNIFIHMESAEITRKLIPEP